MGAIEQLIQQFNFKSERHKAIISLIYTGNLINDRNTAFLKKHGITGQQFNALRILRGHYPKPATVNLIRERMLDKNSDTSRIVERLRKMGLVERVTNELDRRSVDIFITDEGHNLLSKIDKEQTEFERPLEAMSDIEVEQLNLLLDKVLTQHPN